MLFSRRIILFNCFWVAVDVRAIENDVSFRDYILLSFMFWVVLDAVVWLVNCLSWPDTPPITVPIDCFPPYMLLPVFKIHYYYNCFTIIVVFNYSFSSLNRSKCICNFIFSLEMTLIVLINALSWGTFYSIILCKDSLLILRFTLKSSFSCFYKWICLSNSFIRVVAASRSSLYYAIYC